MDCSDGNPCTEYGCKATTGCSNVANTAKCDDGNACTTADACAGGSCGSGKATDCDDGNACTVDTCASATGCVHTNAPLACDDGDACTSQDACDAGSCKAGTQICTSGKFSICGSEPALVLPAGAPSLIQVDLCSLKRTPSGAGPCPTTGTLGQQIRWISKAIGTQTLTITVLDADFKGSVAVDASDGACPAAAQSTCGVGTTTWTVTPQQVGSSFSARILVPSALCGAGVKGTAKIQVGTP